MNLALRPKTPEDRQQALARQEKAQEDVFRREVDEAVRQDRMQSAMRRYGVPALIVAVLVIIGLGGYVWWHGRQVAEAEADAVELTLAMDRIDANRLDEASERLAPLLESDIAGYRAPARMAAAGIALEQGDAAEATRLFDLVADDADAPEALRDLARLRAVSANFDAMEPADVIARLGPIAAPGNPFFGSAGELVAMAQIKQGNEDEAGAMFAQIAREDDVPQSLRARARQMAGVLGTDAVDDPQQVVEDIIQGSAARPRP